MTKHEVVKKVGPVMSVDGAKSMAEQNVQPTVWCLFHNASDNCTYSCQSLVAVYLTKDDAETGLLELVEVAQTLAAEYAAFDTRLRKQMKDLTAFKAIVEEREDWLIRNFGCNWFEGKDPDINSYEIQPVQIGVLQR